MINFKPPSLLFLLFTSTFLCSQSWQQNADYTMSVELDVASYQYKGKQKILYTNNSPETLDMVFYHLYFNAFKPNSEMSLRLKNGKDKNKRFKVSLDSLSPIDQGRLVVFNLMQDGISLNPVFQETILQVPLKNPLGPGKSTVLELEFLGQVPNLIRRAGKNSKENVAFSMAQWYPKLSEYDITGWNTDPYLGREFHGVWGNFDVKITLDKNYTVAASGYLQSNKKRIIKTGKKTWHFIAPKVHDFTWAADDDYVHDVYPGPNGVVLNFFYKNNPAILDNWKNLQPITAELMDYFNTNIGAYPYKQYSVVQGGDGGMEYAMLTLITGERNFRSLVGVTAHELAHSWFQHVLATNETKDEWMDEGFTSYISTLAEDEILKENKPFPLENSYLRYFRLVKSGKEQPQSSNANRYEYNSAYEISAYNKGSIFLSQLDYIMGHDKLLQTLKTYYKEFKFKHPLPNDFRRIAERVSGFQLNWYLTDWTQTTNTIDYKISSVLKNENTLNIQLERVGLMPMPIEVLIEFLSGEKALHYIPLNLMRGSKTNPNFFGIPWIEHTPWSWSNPYYSLLINIKNKNIKSIIIDPSFLMADINRSNNSYYFDLSE